MTYQPSNQFNINHFTLSFLNHDTVIYCFFQLM